MGAATAAVGVFAEKSIEAGRAFDSSMSQVEATMGDAAHKMVEYNGQSVDSMVALRDFAQQMGATTAFSATEASEALNYMALAGYDASQSMEMLPNVLSMAAAGNMDLARASDMLTDTSSALGLTMEQTADLTNQMAVASSKSNTSVEQLGDAMLALGATGKSMKGGTVEIATALGILADNGTKGAEGGTRLRNILLSLGTPTDKAAEALEALGVSAYDSEGNMRPLQDTIGDLNKAMDGMTTQEKNDIINTIFNKTDIADVNYLLGVSSERWETLSADIKDSSGAAETMANVQLDNLNGDITLFQSALEGVQIAISDGITPNMREFVQLGTEGLSEIAAKLQSGDIQGAFDTLGSYLGQFVTKIAEMAPQIIEAAFNLLKSFAGAIMDNIDVILESAVQIITQLALGIGQSLPTLIPHIVEVVIAIVEALIDNADLLIDASIALIVGLAEGLINAVPVLIEKAPVIIAKLISAFVTNAPKIQTAAVKLIGELVVGLIGAIPQLVMAIPRLVTEMINALKNGASSMRSAGTNLVQGMWEGWKQAWSGMVNNVMNSARNLVSSVKDAFGIHSPSKVFAEIGEYCVAGFDEGTEDMFDEVQADNFARNVEASISTQAAGVSSDVQVQSNIILEGDAAGVFRLVKQENRKMTKSVGYNPLMA